MLMIEERRAVLYRLTLDAITQKKQPRDNMGRWAEKPGAGKMVPMSDEEIRKRLFSEEFTRFFENQAGSEHRFAVAWLRPEDRALFGCSGNTLWLSRVSVDEHREKHPEATIDDYRVIPDMVKNAQVWAGHAHRRYLLLWIGGKPYRAAIKTDAKDEEAWFLSLVISGKQKPPKGAVRVR